MTRYIFIFFIIVFSVTGLSAQNIRILFTSNTGGEFSTKIENQEKEDPLILLSQSIQAEKKRGAELYFDLGNGFFPGIVSRFSYGSAVMEFFDYTGINAVLISALDLRIGVDSLEYLAEHNRSTLLSTNIMRDDKNIFKSYVIHKKDKLNIAVLGITSKKILFDIAEKNVYNIKRDTEKTALRNTLNDLKSKNINRIILLSGLDARENIELLSEFEEIDIIVSGGDNKAVLYGSGISRIDRSDGRSIVMIPPSSGYHVLDLNLDNGVILNRSVSKKSEHYKIDTREYRDFISRITLWKKNFMEEANSTVFKNDGRKFSMDSGKLASLVRARYNSEISLVQNSMIQPFETGRDFTYYDIRSGFLDNYSLFYYKISGENLLKLKGELDDYIFDGLTDNKVQNYPVDPARNYSIVSTQPVFETVDKILGNGTLYRNLWKTVPELIKDDLESEKLLYKTDFKFLDDRFRTLVDVFISFLFESSSVSNASMIDPPAGQPVKSYQNIGTEDKINITFYNRYHKIQLLNHIFIVRQISLTGQESYLENIYQGIFLYNLNVSQYINPYLKSQIDTQIFKVDGLAPAILRETLGAILEVKYFTWKLGLGFEKQVIDPEKSLVLGFETTMKFKISFLKYFTYGLGLDMFVSVGSNINPSENGYVKSELENSLTVNVTSIVGLTVKHKWNNYYNIGLAQNYSNSQFITSVSMNSDFKL